MRRLFSLKCFLSQAGDVVTVLHAQGPLQSRGLNTGCFKIVFVLVFCEGKKSKSTEILTTIKAFIKCAPYSSHGTAVDAESKISFALKTC